MRIRSTRQRLAQMAGHRVTSTSSCASAPHEIFERDGDDLHCSVPVSMTTAALGGSIEVPDIAGKAEIESAGRIGKTTGKAGIMACA